MKIRKTDNSKFSVAGLAVDCRRELRGGAMGECVRDELREDVLLWRRELGLRFCLSQISRTKEWSSSGLAAIQITVSPRDVCNAGFELELVGFQRK